MEARNDNSNNGMYRMPEEEKKERERDAANILTPYVQDILFPKLVFIFNRLQLDVSQWTFLEFLAYATKNHKEFRMKGASDSVWRDYCNSLWTNNTTLIRNMVSKKRGTITNQVRMAFFGKYKQNIQCQTNLLPTKFAEL